MCIASCSLRADNLHPSRASALQLRDSIDHHVKQSSTKSTWMPLFIRLTVSNLTSSQRLGGPQRQTVSPLLSRSALSSRCPTNATSSTAGRPEEIVTCISSPSAWSSNMVSRFFRQTDCFCCEIIDTFDNSATSSTSSSEGLEHSPSGCAGTREIFSLIEWDDDERDGMGSETPFDDEVSEVGLTRSCCQSEVT